MAVRIRMKKMGRKHRPFYRICAMDSRSPRDGKALEELGTYDTSLTDVDARAVLKKDRIDYWIGVGAQPSDKVKVLIKKYGTEGTHLEQQESALNNLAQPKSIPDPGKATFVVKPAEEATEEAAPAEAAPAETATEAPAETAEVKTEETVTTEEAPATEEPAAEEASTEAETTVAEATEETAADAELTEDKSE